jgi:O-methyltransferase involved in polyketide biosynthesis
VQRTEISELAASLTGVMATLPLGVRARAEEHQRPDRLFADPTAVAWLQDLPWPAALAAFYDWRFQTGFAVRTRILDDAVERFLDRVDRPVVVELGAGLSTRHARLGRQRATWVALDLPAAIMLRRALEPETAYHRLVAASLTDPEWLIQLADLEPGRVIVTAEGVLGFLTETDLRVVVWRLRRRRPGATIVFDAAGHAVRESIAPHLAGLGAPILWTVQDERDVAALGLTLLEVRPMLAEFPERWGEMARYVETPAGRNSTLLIAARLDPIP